MDNEVLGSVPVDADGNIVPFTTRFMFDEDNIMRKVITFLYSPDDTKWRVRLEGDIHSVSELHNVSDVTLHHHDTWDWLDEDLSNALREVEDHDRAVAYFNNRCDMDCDDCEFADPDNVSETNACSVNTMLLDIRRRIKKICG